MSAASGNSKERVPLASSIREMKSPTGSDASSGSFGSVVAPNSIGTIPIRTQLKSEMRDSSLKADSSDRIESDYQWGARKIFFDMLSFC